MEKSAIAQTAELSTGNFVDGTWEAGQSDIAVEIVNPVTTESLARIALAKQTEVARAVAAAARTFPARRQGNSAMRFLPAMWV